LIKICRKLFATNLLLKYLLKTPADDESCYYSEPLKMNSIEALCKRVFVILALVLCTITLCCASSSVREIQTLKDNKHVKLSPADIESGEKYTVVGIIRLVGSSRFTKLVVTTDNKLTVEMKLNKDDYDKIFKHQYRYIQIEGVIETFTLRLANGKSGTKIHRMKVEKYTILHVNDRNQF
jgi:hypothetical protein